MGINFKAKRDTSLDTMLKGKEKEEEQEESSVDRIKENYNGKDKLSYHAAFQVGDESFEEDIEACCMAEAHLIIYKKYPEAANMKLTEKEI